MPLVVTERFSQIFLQPDNKNIQQETQSLSEKQQQVYSHTPSGGESLPEKARCILPACPLWCREASQYASRSSRRQFSKWKVQIGGGRSGLITKRKAKVGNWRGMRTEISTLLFHGGRWNEINQTKVWMKAHFDSLKGPLCSWCQQAFWEGSNATSHAFKCLSFPMSPEETVVGGPRW